MIFPHEYIALEIYKILIETLLIHIEDNITAKLCLALFRQLFENGNDFNECTELQSLDLSNFYTENVTDMEGMFNKCDKLKYLNLLNFSIKCETKNMMNFNRKDKFKFITNNKDLLALFNSIYL